MQKVDEALAYGVGFLKVEDLKKEQHNMTRQASSRKPLKVHTRSDTPASRLTHYRNLDELLA